MNTEEQIVEVLKANFEVDYDYEGDLILSGKETFKDEKDFDNQLHQIAQEILKNNKWEVVASGEVKNDPGRIVSLSVGDFRLNSLYKYLGKQIEIAVRVIEEVGIRP